MEELIEHKICDESTINGDLNLIYVCYSNVNFEFIIFQKLLCSKSIICFYVNTNTNVDSACVRLINTFKICAGEQCYANFFGPRITSLGVIT